MMMPDLLRTLNAKGRHPKWRAVCPVHQNGSGRHAPRTLAVFADKGGEIGVHCFAGCAKDDVLEALGLTWKDLKPDREWVSPQAFKEAQRKREADEARNREARIGEWCIRFARHGYTLDDRSSDMEVIAACAIVLASKEVQHWHKLLQTHMDRVAAADYCRTHGMLPQISKELKW